MAQEALTKFFSKEGFVNKRGLGIVIAVAILVVASFVPESADGAPAADLMDEQEEEKVLS